jgi:hypothetical protein
VSTPTPSTGPVDPSGAPVGRTPAPVSATENVQRGLLFSLGAIVAAIVGYIVISGIIGVYGYITGIVAVAIPLLGGWLYSKGAGTPVRAGRMPWIGIMVVAIILGALTVVVASGWYSFSRFGKGGILSPAFWTTVVNSAGNGEVILAVVITLAAGGFGIYAALRDKQAKTAVQAPAASPFGTTTPDGAAPAAVAPPAPGTPVATPPVAPPPATPSPGVVLNGEPIDPNAPKA